MLQYDYGSGEERGWILSESNFDSGMLGKGESIMALGNGYMGIRSAYEESYLQQKRNTFIAGTFNKFDGHEPTELPNVPDVAEMKIVLNKEHFSLEKGVIETYRRNLHLDTGELVRTVVWQSPLGNRYRLQFRRFVSLENKHLTGTEVEITSLTGSCTIEITSGINGQLTNTGAQHFREGEKRIYNRQVLEMLQTTTESNIDFLVYSAHHWRIDGEEILVEPAATMSRRRIDASYSYTAAEGQTVSVEKLSMYYTSRDLQTQDMATAELRQYALETSTAEFAKGYHALFSESRNRWKQYWEDVDIQLDSPNVFDQLSIRFAQYHLLIMTPAHDTRFGIGAKGLTGEGYKGHSFWDSEIFILPYFLYNYPDLARGLLEYRYHTLDGARKKARENGYEGAMYPWESGFTGEEETPVWGAANVVTGTATKIWSGFIEQHITADIAYAVWQYFTATRDDEFMDRCGSEMLFETAAFWASRVEWDEAKDAYVIKNVIGPDEYKEHVDNNAFTNYMAQWNIATAAAHYLDIRENRPDVYERLNTALLLDERYPKWLELADRLYLPAPREEDGVVPQDDTYLSKPVIDITKYKRASSVQTILRDYSRDQVIGMQISKQADLVMLMYLMNDRFNEEVQESNWKYYESKTIHDSSLSMAVHSITANRFGDREAAYECFAEAAAIDLGPNMKSSDEGIHAASLGGIWKSIVFGFGGVHMKDGELHLNPRLPESWTRLTFPLMWRGKRLTVTVTPGELEVRSDSAGEFTILSGNKTYAVNGSLKIKL
ncbi:glycoside hydrolase family 65 protein [Paenibacillus gansuensis]|uniref:Glycoside hydrolase family 65 protein n=1 Tax=Paenibacillus gansuensis TaxID=306542 RepID=A0ABW5PC50_9BACL